MVSAKDLISSYKNLPENLHSISEKNESDKTKSKIDKKSVLKFLSNQVTMRTLCEESVQSEATGPSQEAKMKKASKATSVLKSSENQVEQSSPPKQKATGVKQGQTSGK